MPERRSIRFTRRSSDRTLRFRRCSFASRTWIRRADARTVIRAPTPIRSAGRRPADPLPMTRDPRTVFDQLFGVGATPQERAERRAEDRSILDWLGHADGAAQEGAWSRGPRAAVSRTSTKSARSSGGSRGSKRTTPAGMRGRCPRRRSACPDSFSEHVKLMFDLQALAFASDITRVFAFKLGRDASNRVYPESGFKGAFHSASHHGEREDRIWTTRRSTAIT